MSLFLFRIYTPKSQLSPPAVHSTRNQISSISSHPTTDLPTTPFNYPHHLAPTASPFTHLQLSPSPPISQQLPPPYMSNCAISGRLPQEPVVSKKTGHIFEKRLILQHLSLHPTCPITNTPLAKDDLIAVQTTSIVPPRPPTALSFPQLLDTLQNEYDATILENFALRQQLEQVKRDLAKQYYTLDASNRVIARLFKENEELKAKLVETTSATGQITRAIIADNAATASTGAVLGMANNSSINDVETAAKKIDEYVEIGRAKLSGKTNRSVVQKQIAKSFPSADAYLNAVVAKDMVIQTSAQLLTNAVDSTYVMPTSASLDANQVDVTPPYLSFIATQANTVLVVQNNPTTSESKTISTVQPSAITTSSNTHITTLCTSHYSPVQFPWVSNLIQSDSSTTMSDAPTTTTTAQFASFIVSTTNNINQHHIQVYACPADKVANSTDWKCLHTMQTSAPITSLALHPSQRFLIALTNKNVLEFFDTSQPPSVQSLSTQLQYTRPFHSLTFPSSHQLSTIAFHPDCNLVGLGTYNGDLGFLNLKSLESTWLPKSTHLAPNTTISKIIFSQHATQLIVFAQNYGYIVYNLRTQTISHEAAITDLQTICYDQIGDFFALATKKTIIFHKSKDFAQVALIEIPDGASIQELIAQQANASFVGIGANSVVFIQPNSV